MNHLAHVLLAGPDPQARLGAMLGDFWRGTVDAQWPAALQAGVTLHRRIDTFTDAHPVVAAARGLFEPPWRRYAGILIDMLFDHLLARDWARFAPGAPPIDTLSADVLARIDAQAAMLPAALVGFAAYMRRHGLFAAYAQRATIERAVAGIGSRLRHANPLHKAGPVLWSRIDALEAAFADFFPALREEAARLRVALDLA